ncbi:autotransporter outer membrane beta-barrel domain-containing protein [Phreatobacter stygius]|nr:autotransporter domain-containing protein [Phreatobacter stygius]
MSRRGAWTRVHVLLAATALTAAAAPAVAQDATWLANPGSNVLSTANNWSGGAVPTGTATFGASSTTSLIVSADQSLGGLYFAAGAPAYSFSRQDPSDLMQRIRLTGVGLQAAAGADYTLNLDRAGLNFYNSASTGSVTINAVNSLLYFYDNSTAAASRILVSGGTAYFYGNSSAGSVALTLDNGAVQFEDSSTAANAIITTQNSTAIWFFDSSSAGSAKITTAGQLRVGNTATLSNATLDLAGNTTFGGQSSAGAATITNRRAGWVDFNNDSTAGQASILNLGAILFSDQSSTGTATIDNRNYLSMRTTNAGAGLILNSGTLLVSGYFGTGGLGQTTVVNTGSMTLISAASGQGATIDNRGQGTLRFSFGTTAGSAIINNAGTTTFVDNATAGSATINNTGRLRFQDDASTGTATITSASRIEMATTDTKGAATITLRSGGALSGHGAVGNTTVQSGATFAPSGGTLVVNGNLTLYAGGTYAFAPGGLTTATGTATLGGGNLSFKAVSFADQSHTVLTAAGGVAGTFTLLGDGAVGSIVYNPNDVQLTVKGYRAGTALAGQGGRNLAHVAAVIDRVIDATGTQPGFIPTSLIGVTGATLATQLSRLTGEAGTGAVSTGLTGASTFLGIMLDPMAGARGATANAPGSSLIEMADIASVRTPAARVEAAWSIWTKAYGQAGRTASDTGLGAAGSASSLYGVAAGADRLVAPGLVVGFAVAGGGSSFGLGTRGSGSGDFAQIGAYGSMRLGPGHVSAALAYGWNRFDVTRDVSGFGLTETYRSGPVGHTFGGRLEAGRRFGLGQFGLTPYAAAEAIAYVAPGYRESWDMPATGAFALAYAGRTTGTLRAELGARADALVASAETGDLLAFSRLAYAVQSNTQRGAEAQFQTLAGSTFAVFGARASTHTALATLGVEARFRQGFAASLALDGEVGDRHRALRGSVALRQSW